MLLNEKLKTLLDDSGINSDNFDEISKEKMETFLSKLNHYFYKQEEENKKIESDLKKYRAVVDTTPSTISWINNRYEYIGVNRAMKNLLPLAEGEYLGKQVGFHSNNDYFLNFAKDLFREPDKIIYRELASVLKSGEEKYFWIVGSQYDEGKEAVIIGIDITDFKSLRGQLEVKEKMAVIGVMAAGMAHEIKNPLALVKGNAEMIKLKIEKGNITKERTLELLNSIDKNANRIDKIVKGLQNFSRQSDSDPYLLSPLHPVVEEAVSLCIDKLKRLDISLNYDKFPKNLEAYCRTGEINQVLVNFINNASDAIELLEEKWIRIEGEVLNNEVKISVIDSGKGIPIEIKNKIFDAFYTTKPLGKGTGLGLSICKGIIEGHGGHLDIETHAPNTTFIFTLPLLR